MRIPLTKYGLPQVVIFPAIVLAAMVAWPIAAWLFNMPGWAFWPIEIVLAAVFVWLLLFFRDPYRICPLDKKLMLAPADGKITAIETIEHNDYIGGSALKISIFLSIFNVHINRSCCNARVEKIIYKKGQFKDARDTSAHHLNESNELYMSRLDEPQDKIIIRQVAGLIARRIVCDTEVGRELKASEKFGMIKFGSRTELIIPAGEHFSIMVKEGDNVKAGQTTLVKYK